MFRVFLSCSKCLKSGVVKGASVSLKTSVYTAYWLTVFYIYLGSSKEGGAGAVDEDDFIKAFTDVPTVQVKRLCILMFLWRNMLFVMLCVSLLSNFCSFTVF